LRTSQSALKSAQVEDALGAAIVYQQAVVTTVSLIAFGAVEHPETVLDLALARVDRNRHRPGAMAVANCRFKRNMAIPWTGASA
jgi:hypothetical protein